MWSQIQLVLSFFLTIYVVTSRKAHVLLIVTFYKILFCPLDATVKEGKCMMHSS